MNKDETPKIAILIPCYNEAPTVGAVIDAFRKQLPDAPVYVFDNCCTDDTAAIAAGHGAQVIREPRKGKGYAVERMFDCVRADYYVMVDGDDTYPAEAVHELLAPVRAGNADMVVGARLQQYGSHSFRPLHVAGNNLVRSLINRFFGAELTDILSGYRAFNRNVVRRVPVVSPGFEIETELTIQALYNRCKIEEIQVAYRSRPAGSFSKLNTFADGFRVVWKLFSLVRSVKPLTFFGGIAAILFVLGLLTGVPPIHDYLTSPTHFVAHVPLAILATGLMLLSGGSFFVGLLLHAINWRFKELHALIVRSSE